MESKTKPFASVQRLPDEGRFMSQLIVIKKGDFGGRSLPDIQSSCRTLGRIRRIHSSALTIHKLYLQTLKYRSCFLTFPEPTLLARKSILLHTLLLHLYTVSWFRRCHIVALLDNRRMMEVLM